MERGGGRESVADLLRHSLTAKGGNEGCWSGCLGRSTAETQTDRRASTAFFIDPDIGTAAGTGYHRPKMSLGQTIPKRDEWSARDNGNRPF